jgi:putative restriction endonuclease
MDDQIRMQAFKWLGEMDAIHKGDLPRNILEKGFDFKGERITLLGPRGIWKPKTMQLPLSITSIASSAYEDREEGGLLEYKYRGTDPNHVDNVGLRKIMENNIPIIYFFSIIPGWYLASWPAYIQSDNRRGLSFTVALDEPASLKNDVLHEPDTARRNYVTSQIWVRLHQRTFREKVLAAYNTQCTLCRLAHRELLDAAHIIPDAEERGEPIVSNGLTLCKIHHAAYDSNILGISADYEVEVRNDILEEIDGPMLKYGIQDLHKQKIILPKNQMQWPDKQNLDIRFQKFQGAILRGDALR